jgi:hypothetical protein
VNTSRTLEEGAQSLSWLKGLIIIVIIMQMVGETMPTIGTHGPAYNHLT